MKTLVAEQLSTIYRAPMREAGLRVVLRSLIRREERRIEAVRDLSFAIGAGEAVSFIEPNRAIKMITLKVHH